MASNNNNNNNNTISMNSSSATSSATNLVSLVTEALICVKQLNLHHSKAASALVFKAFEVMQTKKQNQIFLIQEPWTVNNQINGFDTSLVNLFSLNPQNSPPRACVVASKGLNVTLMPQFSDRDITTTLLKVGSSYEEIYIITSFYLANPSSEEIPVDMFRAIVQCSDERKIPIILGGDANSHHTVWGSTDINRRGELLCKYIATTDLEILNKGISPTFVTRNRSEVLDITLATQNISHMRLIGMFRWRTLSLITERFVSTSNTPKTLNRNLETQDLQIGMI